MSTGTKIFRVLICTFLALTMLWTAYMSYAFIYYVADEGSDESFELYVAGELVMGYNAGDVLGDGTVSYNPENSTLTLNNATIEYSYSAIYSLRDLRIELVGENKLICKDYDVISAVYVSKDILRQDLTIDGEGSLEIVFENVSQTCTGIVANDLFIDADVTVTIPDVSNLANGVVCTSDLTLRGNGSLTVNNGAGRSSTAVSVRGNAILENGSAMTIKTNPGSEEACNGLVVYGTMSMGRDVTLNVAIDDASAERSNCVSVLSTLSIGRFSTVNVSAKKATALECSGSLLIHDGAVITANTADKGTDILCVCSLVNYEATINGEVEALGGIHNREND